MSWEHIRNPKTVEQRFGEKADKSGDCWIWIASKMGKGYGGFWYKGRFQRAHRVSWQLHFGEIPAGMFVCHHCDNPLCVNPSHLFLGTNADNVKDCRAKGRHINGERNGRAKLSHHDIPIIQELAKFGFTQKYLSKHFGVSRQNIASIIYRKTWKHIQP
jgi:hypothetical protein